MRAKLLGFGGLIIVLGLQLSGRTTTAQGQGPAQDVRALYDRAESLGRRTQGLMYNVAEAPTWIEGSAQFWYRKSVKGGNEFVVADPAAKTKAPAFDHAKLAAGLSTAASAQYTAVTLPFNSFTFVNNRQSIEFTVGPGGGGRAGGGGGGGGAGRAGGGGANTLPRWRCSLTDYTCARQTAPAGQNAQQAGGGQGRGGGRGGGVPGEVQTKVSPDGKQEALIQNFNVYVRPAGGGANAANGTLLSTDGSEGNSYTFQSMQWSPDSRKIVAFRRRPGYERLVHYVESSPTDQLQPKHTTNFYRKPGDVVDLDVPVLFDVATKKQDQGDVSLFPESVREHAAQLAQGQPRGDVRVQPARPPALSRARARCDDGEDAHVDRRDEQDVRRVLRQEVPQRRRRWQGNHLGVGARRLEPVVPVRRRHRAGEEPDHEGQLGYPGRRRRRRGQAPDLVPRERHAPGQGPVPRSVLPRELRRHGADGAHRRGRQSQRDVLAEQGVLRRLLVARRFAAAVRAEARERSKRRHGSREGRRHRPARDRLAHA